jgi:hypothetical protein
MDRLYEFACEYLEKNPVHANMPVSGAPYLIAQIEARLLFRNEDMQVQLFNVPSHYIIPAHTHPNVDSIQVYVDGEITFSHRGEFVFEAIGEPVGTEPSSFKWRMIRVGPGDKHGAVAGAAGARFMSIQQWLGGIPPHCVGADYNGPVFDLDHLPLVKSGKPIARCQSELTAKDAL